MFKWLFSDKVKHTTGKTTVVINPTVSKSIWRNNMWVMTPEGVGIIFELREPVRVHLVDENGLTRADKEFPSNELRQARYLEIPYMRRGDQEKAKRLGYE